MAVLFHSLDGMDWIGHTKWLSSNHECDWYGITCDDDFRIVKIELAHNRLSGTIPAEIAEFMDLQMLNLSRNPYVMGTIPWEVFELEYLDVDVSGTSVDLVV